MKCQLLRQATMEDCGVWKHALGMSLGSLRRLFVKFFPLPLVPPLLVVLTLLISWKWAWWMSAVHPQHLVLRRIDVEVAARMETEEKGDFLLDRSKDGTTQVLHTWGFYFAFLPCLHSTVLLSFPWTRHLAYFALPLLSHCHWNTKNPTQPCVLSQTVWPPFSGSLHRLAVFANRISSYSTTEPEPLFWMTTDHD